MAGGHFTAQSPLQTDLPVPAGSRSKVYSVMPLASTSMPPFIAIGGALPGAIEAQPASRTAARARDSDSFLLKLFLHQAGDMGPARAQTMPTVELFRKSHAGGMPTPSRECAGHCAPAIAELR